MEPWRSRAWYASRREQGRNERACARVGELHKRKARRDCSRRATLPHKPEGCVGQIVVTKLSQCTSRRSNFAALFRECVFALHFIAVGILSNALSCCGVIVYKSPRLKVSQRRFRQSDSSPENALQRFIRLWSWSCCDGLSPLASSRLTDGGGVTARTDAAARSNVSVCDPPRDGHLELSKCTEHGDSPVARRLASEPRFRFRRAVTDLH